jgi:HAD superfamily hydrolase (TIGR01490 family)
MPPNRICGRARFLWIPARTSEIFRQTWITERPPRGVRGPSGLGLGGENRAFSAALGAAPPSQTAKVLAAHTGRGANHTINAFIPHIATGEEARDGPRLRQMSRSAAFFDLDKTVIARSSVLAFGRPFYQGGLINRRAVLKSSYAQFVYLVNGADEEQMERMRAYLTDMCRGWEVEQVKQIVAETLHDLIDPIIYEEAAALIEEHRAAGRDVVIVSSSGEEVVSAIGELLGADHVIATRMVVEDGRYTGEIAYYAAGPNKATAIVELAQAKGYDLSASFAYSDSITDAPMLEVVGHPTAVNPDKALRRLAAERGWPAMSFKRPVRLRSRFPQFHTPSRPVLASAGVSVGLAAAGIAWYLRRRRRAIV